MIKERLRELPGLAAHLTFLSPARVTELLALIEWTRSHGLPQAHEDFSSAGSDAPRNLVTRWLADIETCEAVWPFDRTGAIIHASVLAANIDDFWYPSSDDLWIHDGRHLILIDHEEFAELWAL